MNYRIIQSEYGISIDQYNHIQQSSLQDFFDKGTTVPFQSSPFILDQSIEMDLFKDGPLSEDECASLDERYNGTYSYWTGALLHIAEKSQWDLQYLAMRLAGYNNCPSTTYYRILYLGMCYLYRHPHIPIIFPSKLINEEVPLKSHFAKGEAEISTKDHAKYTGLQVWPDAGFVKDIAEARRSASSSVHTWGDVVFASQYVKQPEPAASTKIAESRSLFQATRRTLAYRSILRSLDMAQKHPTPTHEDNTAMIAQVLNDILTPRVKHISVIISWINNQLGRNLMDPVACPSALEKGDINTKNMADQHSKKSPIRQISILPTTNLQTPQIPPSRRI